MNMRVLDQKFPDVAQSSTFEILTRFIGLFILAPILLVSTIPVPIHIGLKPDLGFAVHNLTVHSLTPGGPADTAGFKISDQILEVDGLPIPSMAQWYAATSGNYERLVLQFKIQRGEEVQILALQPDPPNQMTMIRDYCLWAAGLAFLGIGWWVFWRRKDIVARNFFALCLMFAFLLLDIPELPHTPYMVFKENLRALTQLMLPAYFLRFFLHFPSPRLRPGGTSRRWRQILAIGWTLFALFLIMEWVLPDSLAARLMPVFEGIALFYSLGFFILGLVVFTRRIFRKNRPIERTRMLVVLFGLVMGLLPFMAALVIANLDPGTWSAKWQYLAFSLLLVPVSFGLSIMRYGALDRSFILRISLIYGLLTLTVLITYYFLFIGLGHLLLRLYSIDTFPILLMVLATCSLTILPLRRFVQRWIDDIFYPGRRIHHEAVTALARELTRLIDLEKVSRHLLTGLDNLYHPRSLHLATTTHSEAADFTIQAHCYDPQEQTPPLVLSCQSGLGVLLDRLRRPVFTEELEDLLFTGDSDAQSLNLLTRMGTHLLVPLISGNRLLGFMALGPKKAGSLYTQEDFSYLNDLAVQSGSILESRQLYRESLQRKVVETELDLARRIQTGLLPGEALVDDAFVIAGRHESCHMVGGDYFDYFIRKDGCLGFAIADVAGKGIPAALHMTSLRVAFRQEAELEDIPRLVVQRLNRSVAHLVAPGHFICLFFGVLDPSTGVLTYCNAGLEPPILKNPQRTYCQYLRKGGPLLGVTEEIEYRQGTITLKPGDRLFLYTDGVTDQQNSEGEFFDIERLLALLEARIGEPPTQLLDNVFTRINAFGGTDRTDDKTAISLEIKRLG